jgi:8-oxo-dGTP diphosphatase
VAALTVIRAAGGVLWRNTSDMERLAVVHRPRYDDWTLPKGKLKRGEHPLEGACREVLEETGVRPAVRTRLKTISYLVPTDRSDPEGSARADKVVDYWTMTPTETLGFTPGSEIDRVAWLSVDEARERLTYDHDREVVSAFAKLPRVTGVVIVARHTSAGERGSWPGPDQERPLDATGVTQARRMARLLRLFAPARLVSASPWRCVDSLKPLSTKVGLPIEVDTTFDETADPASAAKRLKVFAATRQCTVVCSQRGLIAPMLSALTRRAESSFETPKGKAWVMSFAGKRVVAWDDLP